MVQKSKFTKSLETSEGGVQIHFLPNRRIILDGRFSTFLVHITQKERNQPRPTNVTYATYVENYEPSIRDFEINAIELEKEFQINKKLLRKDFNSKNNKEKRKWFLFIFVKTNGLNPSNFSTTSRI